MTGLVRRWTRPTAVYCHRWSGAGGTRRGGRAYVGMSNRPDLRRGQHAAGAWWWPLTDPALYSQRWHRTRIGAAVAEATWIRLFSPPGNIRHNRRYREQTAQREFLRVSAGGLRTRREWNR